MTVDVIAAIARGRPIVARVIAEPPDVRERLAAAFADLAAEFRVPHPQYADAMMAASLILRGAFE